MDTRERYRELFRRRDAIRHVSALLGGIALVGQSALLAAEEPPPAGKALFSTSELNLLDDMAETLLPETETPGARAAGVGPFVAMMVADLYEEPEQRLLVDGIRQFDQRCRSETGKSFGDASAAERLAVMQAVDREQVDYMAARGDDTPVHYFRLFKELALLGYFTSEVGYTYATRYVETPGRYEPCVDYEAGERAWASRG